MKKYGFVIPCSLGLLIISSVAWAEPGAIRKQSASVQRGYGHQHAFSGQFSQGILHATQHPSTFKYSTVDVLHATVNYLQKQNGIHHILMQKFNNSTACTGPMQLCLNVKFEKHFPRKQAKKIISQTAKTFGLEWREEFRSLKFFRMRPYPGGVPSPLGLDYLQAFQNFREARR